MNHIQRKYHGCIYMPNSFKAKRFKMTGSECCVLYSVLTHCAGWYSELSPTLLRVQWSWLCSSLGQFSIQRVLHAFQILVTRLVLCASGFVFRYPFNLFVPMLSAVIRAHPFFIGPHFMHRYKVLCTCLLLFSRLSGRLLVLSSLRIPG